MKIIMKNSNNIDLKIPLLRGGCRQADGVEGFYDLASFSKPKTSTPSASTDTPQEGNN